MASLEELRKIYGAPNSNTGPRRVVQPGLSRPDQPVTPLRIMRAMHPEPVETPEPESGLVIEPEFDIQWKVKGVEREERKAAAREKRSQQRPGRL